MPIVNPIWFYLADFCNDINVVAWLVLIAGGLATGILLKCVNDTYDDEDRNFFKKMSSKFWKVVIACAVIIAITPSCKTVQEMAVASVVTYENVEAAKGEATELIDYIIDSVNKLNNGKECE